MSDYLVGDELVHHAGSRWRITEHIGGPEDDYRAVCIVGTEKPGWIGGEREGREVVFHAEYLPRSFRRVPSTVEAPVDPA